MNLVQIGTHEFLSNSPLPEGLSTIPERSRRVGRTKSASKPARIQPDEGRLKDRCRKRFTIIEEFVLRRSDSATRERTPPGPSNRAKVAMKWIKKQQDCASQNYPSLEPIKLVSGPEADLTISDLQVLCIWNSGDTAKKTYHLYAVCFRWLESPQSASLI
jgi:hypothetical protein